MSLTFKRVFAVAGLSLVFAGAVRAQDQIDVEDGDDGAAAVPLSRKARAANFSKGMESLAVRVRVNRAVPEQSRVAVGWRRGGEGLGGEVRRGEFLAEDKSAEFAAGAWSAWLPMNVLAKSDRSWEFPTLAVSGKDAKNKKMWLSQVEVEFQFAEAGKVMRSFTEPAPDGATVSFAFPSPLLALTGKTDASFWQQVSGLSGYVAARRERLEKEFAGNQPLPKQFGLIGQLGGYGQGVGYGIRHNNPEIVRDEARTLRLLGINGLREGKSLELARQVGMAADFERIYSGSPGASAPTVYFRNLWKKGVEVESDPFDPALRASMLQRVEQAIKEHREAGTKLSWSLWWDEMGVAVMVMLNNPTGPCSEAFREYLRKQNLQPMDVGATDWAAVKPYPLWTKDAKGRNVLAPTPAKATDALLYYYSYRFMTYATGDLFREANARFKAAGIALYSMQTPSPTWRGANLDWHEFYDQEANGAVVFETSNRDPRIWQWESYLADISRGIAERHGISMGALVKPHRGATQQRALTLVARGAQAIQWYTYGPDYAKGDSFSARPQLLDQVARFDRFLGMGEEYLYGAQLAEKPQVAFVSPRSSEIWGKTAAYGDAAFEDAKWVYLALNHAHIPVDVLSEQQLAEGKLGQYKVIYVVGANLRRDAASQVQEWVRRGGLLWTDALGMSRNESNQPSANTAELLGLKERSLESWGTVPVYGSTQLRPFEEKEVPAAAVLKIPGGTNVGEFRAVAGREPLVVKDGVVEAQFADGRPAVVRHRFGAGETVAVGTWAGLAYSRKVREPGFEMQRDFEAQFRVLIAGPALERVKPSVVPSEPLVEAVALKKDNRRCIALMNWNFAAGGNLKTAKNLRIALSGMKNVTEVRSIKLGKLALQGTGESLSVVLPVLDEVDLLAVE